MEQWLLETWDFFATNGPFSNRMQPNFLPGWTYARALAMFITEQKKGDKVTDTMSNELETDGRLTRSSATRKVYECLARRYSGISVGSALACR